MRGLSSSQIASHLNSAQTAFLSACVHLSDGHHRYYHYYVSCKYSRMYVGTIVFYKYILVSTTNEPTTAFL